MAKAKTRSNTVAVVEGMIEREYNVDYNTIVNTEADAHQYNWEAKLGSLGCAAPYENCSYGQYETVCNASIELSLENET